MKRKTIRKPPIKGIQIEAGLFDGRKPYEYRFIVTFNRWASRNPKTCEARRFYSRTLYHPTPASIARCRRAQEAMVAGRMRR